MTTKRNKEEYMTQDDNKRNKLIYCDRVKMLLFLLKYFVICLVFLNIFYIFALLGGYN